MKINFRKVSRNASFSHIQQTILVNSSEPHYYTIAFFDDNSEHKAIVQWQITVRGCLALFYMAFDSSKTQRKTKIAKCYCTTDHVQFLLTFMNKTNVFLFVWQWQSSLHFLRRCLTRGAVTSGNKIGFCAKLDLASYSISYFENIDQCEFTSELNAKTACDVHGRREGGAGGSWPLSEFWRFQQKRVVFLVSRGKKQFSPLLAPHGKFLEKYPNGPRW